MRITVIGATGRTGVHVLTQALDEGHEVVALVRTPEKLVHHEGALRVARGDATNSDDVAAAVAGADAVIMAAGPTRNGPRTMLVDASRAVVSAMTRTGCTRIIWLTGAAVTDERDGRAFSRSVVRGIMKILAGDVLASSEEACRIIRSSGLDYTIVRPPMLSDKPGGIGLTAGYEPPRPVPVGRADLARFLLAAATEGTWVGGSPFVSYASRK